MAVAITVCVGSSCHVRGSRALLQRFAAVIAEGHHDAEVAVAGCFCMDRCGEMMNWKFNDEPVASASVDEAEQTLRRMLNDVLFAR